MSLVAALIFAKSWEKEEELNLLEFAISLDYIAPFIYMLGIQVDRHCDSCGQKDSCKTIYGKLGDSKLPPVLLNVVIALLLPLILFIGTIVAAEKFFFEEIANSLWRNLLSIAAAIIVVGLYLVILKLCRFLLRSIKH